MRPFRTAKVRLKDAYNSCEEKQHKYIRHANTPRCDSPSELERRMRVTCFVTFANAPSAARLECPYRITLMIPLGRNLGIKGVWNQSTLGRHDRRIVSSGSGEGYGVLRREILDRRRH